MGAGVDAGKLTAVQTIARRHLMGLRQLVEPQDPMVGGLSVVAWVSLWAVCHEREPMAGGVRRIEWPDEGGVARQSAVVVRMFGLINEQVRAVDDMNRSKT